MQKILTTVVAAALVALPVLSASAFAGQKEMPSAFGKELVPDEQTNERNEEKTGENEDLKDREDRDAVRSSHHGGHVGGKIHIQLDGDEDGGGDGDSDGGDDD